MTMGSAPISPRTDRMEILDKETNDMHARFSSSRSTRRTAAVGALILLASSLLCLNAATVNGRGVLIGSPFTAEGSDRVVVAVSNVGRRPMRFRVHLLRAIDFEPIFVTAVPQVLGPRSSSFDDVTLSVGLGIIAVIEVESRGKTEAETSLQVIDAGGETKIFSDGFESGNTSQ